MQPGQVDGLWLAANERDLVKVERLVKDLRVDPNVMPAGRRGRRPLHQAVANGDLGIVKALVGAARIQVDAADGQGIRPLHQAAGLGNLEIVKALLAKADPNAINGPLGTALHAAARHGRLDVTTALLDHADPDTADAFGSTALHLAVRHGDAMVVAALLGKANPDLADGEGFTPLHWAVKTDNLPALSCLLDKADPYHPNLHGNTPLHMAAALGRTGIVVALLAHCDPRHASPSGLTALIAAARFNRLEALKVLIGCSDPNAAMNDGVTALHMAALEGHDAIVDALMEHCPVNARMNDGATPLYLAAAMGHPVVVERLLRTANPDMPNHDGMRPLHVAAQVGNTEIVRLLLDKADPDARTPDGSTALHEAARRGHEEVVKALLMKANPDAPRNDGSTALHLAVFGKRLGVVRTLLEVAYPDAVAADGSTALHAAAYAGDLAILRAVMGKADPNVQMRNGRFALEIALAAGRASSVHALVEKADPNVLVPALFAPHIGPSLIRMVRAGMHELDALPNDEARKIAILERWSQYRAHGTGHARLNKQLTAQTNLLLGQLLAAREIQWPLAADACGKGAVFRLALALEQTLDGGDEYNRAPEIARVLIAVAPATTTYFNLSGVPVPRREIEDLARAHGPVALASALDQTMQHIRSGWGANVHLGGFLLLGQNLLDEINVRNARYQQRSGGAAIPDVSGADIDLAALPARPITEALQTGLYRQYRLVLERPHNQRAIFQFMTSKTSAGLAPLAGKLLAELLALGPDMLVSLDPGLQPGEIEKRLQAGEICRLLANMKSELQLGPRIVEAIEREAPALEAGEIDSALRAHLVANLDESLAGLACKGLAHVWSVSGRISEEGLDTDTHSVLDALWRYISHQPDHEPQDGIRQGLMSMLILQLAGIGLDPVCNTGCVQRLLMDAGTVDTTLQSREPDAEFIKDRLQMLALEVTSMFDDEHAGNFDGDPNRADHVIELKQAMVEAGAIEELVRRRGWKKDNVRAVLGPVLEQIKDL